MLECSQRWTLQLGHLCIENSFRRLADRHNWHRNCFFWTVRLHEDWQTGHGGLRASRSEPLETKVSVQTFKVGVQYILQTGYLPLDRLGGGRFVRKIVAFRSMLPNMVNAQHCWRFKWQTLLLFICSQRKVKHPFDVLPIMDPQNRIDPFQKRQTKASGSCFECQTDWDLIHWFFYKHLESVAIPIQSYNHIQYIHVHWDVKVSAYVERR